MTDTILGVAGIVAAVSAAILTWSLFRMSAIADQEMEDMMEKLRGYDQWKTEPPDIPEPREREVIITFEVSATCIVDDNDEYFPDAIEKSALRIARRIMDTLWYNVNVGTDGVEVSVKGVELL